MSEATPYDDRTHVDLLLQAGDAICEYLTKMKPLEPIAAECPLDFESFAAEDRLDDETEHLVRSWQDRAAQVRKAFQL